MSRLISVLILAAVLLGGWQLYLHWNETKDEKSVRDAEEAALNISPSSLAGLPPSLEHSLAQACKEGARGLRSWLRQYGDEVEDPRLAWIQLDYVVLVARDNTAEARKVFAEVRNRLKPNSPVYPRMKQLEKTYSQ